MLTAVGLSLATAASLLLLRGPQVFDGSFKKPVRGQFAVNTHAVRESEKRQPRVQARRSLLMGENAGRLTAHDTGGKGRLVVK